MQSDGAWVNQTYFGTQTEGANQKFDIMVVTANQSATAALIGYQAMSKKNNTFNGLETLPDGTYIQKQITVTRV